MTRTEELYQQYVIAHGLERAGLFALLRERYGPPGTVLYPGCFLHLTPSFYFQHVVYVDRNELAARFFAETTGVLQAISARKQYRQKPHVRFISQDFTEPLEVPAASFGLLLALYAGGICRSCVGYLKGGGLLLSNDHEGDAAEAAAHPELELVAVVMERRDTYELLDGDLSGYLVPKQKRGPGTSRTLGRPDYERSAHYYVFRKTSAGRAGR